jgi:hypothetical protein
MGMRAYGERVTWGTAQRKPGEKAERRAAAKKARQAGRRECEREG